MCGYCGSAFLNVAGASVSDRFSNSVRQTHGAVGSVTPVNYWQGDSSHMSKRIRVGSGNSILIITQENAPLHARSQCLCFSKINLATNRQLQIMHHNEHSSPNAPNSSLSLSCPEVSPQHLEVPLPFSHDNIPLGSGW